MENFFCFWGGGGGAAGRSDRMGHGLPSPTPPESPYAEAGPRDTPVLPVATNCMRRADLRAQTFSVASSPGTLSLVLCPSRALGFPKAPGLGAFAHGKYNGNVESSLRTRVEHPSWGFARSLVGGLGIPATHSLRTKAILCP